MADAEPVEEAQRGDGLCDGTSHLLPPSALCKTIEGFALDKRGGVEVTLDPGDSVIIDLETGKSMQMK